MISLLIHHSTYFIYLNNEITDYDMFKASIVPHQWIFFNDTIACRQFITAHPMNPIVLIISSNLLSDLFKQIDNLPNISSIYIYYQESNNIQQWTADLKKIQGSFKDPVLILKQIQADLYEKGYNMPAILIDEQQQEQACTLRNTCTKNMPVKGKGTIQLSQKTSFPFELIISTKPMPDDPEAYALVLKVDSHESSISLFKNQRLHILERKKHAATLVQSNDGNWETYWLSYFKETSMIRYGVGEMRPRFSMLEHTLPFEDNTEFAQIQYLHVKLDNDSHHNQVAELENNIKIKIRPEPITVEPALLVVSSLTFEQASRHTAITLFSLDKPCQELYQSVINLSLNDQDFPQLTQAIERSVKNPNLWCYQKLREKSRGVVEATYLRITVGPLEGRSPGHTYVIEIWPPGHYSPIHSHSNSYAIIRVLYGKILVKLYPSLSVSKHQTNPLIEQVFDEGQVTWISPFLNQTHQVHNVDTTQCCVTIQSYYYGPEDEQHYEYFDYVTSDVHQIQRFKPTSDKDFEEFKRMMKTEWENA